MSWRTTAESSTTRTSIGGRRLGHAPPFRRRVIVTGPGRCTSVLVLNVWTDGADQAQALEAAQPLGVAEEQIAARRQAP